jgi:predicted RNase H-like HicB family nuclease
VAVQRIRIFSISDYVEAALHLAEYERDEDGVVVASVPGASGFYAQGESHEEARTNLEDVIEGNVVLALQLGWELPGVPGIDIEERDVETHST